MATATSSFFLCWLLLVQLAILGGAEEQDGMITWDDLFLKDDETPSIYVAKDDSGDVETIQAAFELVPANLRACSFLCVFLGRTGDATFQILREKITLDSTKPYVSLIGADRSTTIITWNETAGSTGNTTGSATMTIRAKFFCAFNMTIENSAPSPLPGERNKQAVALLLSAEKTIIFRCNILGFQDTLYDQQGVHLLYQSYIRGTIDFICGSGQSLYKDCTLDSVAESYGAFTASQRSRADDSGFVFSGCELKGSGQLYLGRTWGAFARVIFTGCLFTDVVRPEGWGTMGSSGPTSDVFLGEFNCTGPGSNLSQRVPWMHKLSEDEMKPFLGYTFINGVEWLKLDPVQGGAKG